MIKVSFYKVLTLAILSSFLGCNHSSQEEQNIEIIKSTYHDFNNLKNHLAPNVIWKEADGFPYAGTYIGYDDIVENVFSKLAIEWIDFKFTPDEFMLEDDKVVAIGHYRGTNIKSGFTINIRALHLYHLKNNKITHFEQFVDTKKVVDAMK
ncbi:nuclear transport factor 2 family protein [Maribacter sp. BPC-D8]|uniref:nuclear transport factor 2 family protein n=1 Tax=Maribacter sp. BPC-D8 TaxID=3053613 RepID=UPI002B47B93D|nr:nuclear transport factor 2 family protein [Maribacter sp. BPC-D8]WRI30557.1 nuclear transport factor 2 family protein [Maribacter sp. BPC-D8]